MEDNTAPDNNRRVAHVEELYEIIREVHEKDLLHAGQGCRRPAGLSGRPDRPGAWPVLSGQGSNLSGRTTPTLSIMQYVRRASD